MYDTGEYNVKLEIPTDNYVVYNLFPSHLETISSFLGGCSCITGGCSCITGGGSGGINLLTVSLIH